MFFFFCCLFAVVLPFFSHFAPILLPFVVIFVVFLLCCGIMLFFVLLGPSNLWNNIGHIFSNTSLLARHNTVTACKARVSNKRVHFKHCREIGNAIQGMGLTAALKYLENVLEKKETIPFRVFTGGVGRHAQVNCLLPTETWLYLFLILV